MGKKHYDIFISYRREGGFELAQPMAQHLKSLGYSVFFDIESLRQPGRFNDKLYEVIDNCKDFVVIFPKETEAIKGRLQKPDDWVHMELAHAMEKKKNIIPVLLRGFTFPKDLPMDIQEVQYYQGVAAGDWNYFDASMLKLQELLISKRGFFRRYKYLFLGLIAAFVILGAIFAYNHYQNKKIFTATCVEQVKHMSGGMGIINDNLNLVHNVYKRWCEFYQKFNAASPRDTSFIRKEFLSYLDHSSSQILERGQIMRVSDESASILRKNGIEAEEVAAFYEMVIPNFGVDVQDFISSIKNYSIKNNISDSYIQFADQLYQLQICSSKVDYYGFLSILKTMPDEAFAQFKKMHPDFNNFREISITLPKEEYDIQAEAMFAEYERIYSELSGVTNKAYITTEEVEYALKKNMEDMEQAIVTEKLVGIQEKSKDVKKIEAELASAEKQLAEMYKSSLERFAILPDDSQGEMWGKALRIATLAYQSQIKREEGDKMYEDQVTIAKQNGIDPSLVTKTLYTYSLDEMYNNVYKWLDTYQKYNPGSNKYVTAAKRFYAAIHKGIIPYNGVIMVATKDNVPHPTLEIGDIIVERKGHIIKDVDHYSSLKDDPAENSVKILRFSDDGKPQFITKTIPANCTILVGLAELTETL